MRCPVHPATLDARHIVQPQEHPVRAATIAASIVALGLYLFVAATFAFSPAWIGLGMLAIALVGAATAVLADQPEAGALR
jgi:hypothetical protein